MQQLKKNHRTGFCETFLSWKIGKSKKQKSGHLKCCKSLIINDFTLIELLVVIAVIAILAAMLLPALNRAREVSKRIKCVSNMKQVSLVFMNYADSYEEWFPCRLGSINYDTSGGGTTVAWSYFLAETTNMVKYENMTAGIKSTNILTCPSARVASASTNFGINDGIRLQAGNASMRQRGVWQCSSDGGFAKRNTFKSPSRVAVLFDCNENTYYVNPATTQYDIFPGGINFRHSNTTNGLFVDGHVENMLRGDVLFWASTAIRINKPWF